MCFFNFYPGLICKTHADILLKLQLVVFSKFRHPHRRRWECRLFGAGSWCNLKCPTMGQGVLNIVLTILLTLLFIGNLDVIFHFFSKMKCRIRRHTLWLKATTLCSSSFFSLTPDLRSSMHCVFAAAFEPLLGTHLLTVRQDHWWHLGHPLRQLRWVVSGPGAFALR